MVYLFLNTDEYLTSQRVAALRLALGEAELADLNASTLDGAKYSAAEILGQCAMMPFLAPRRLVVVEGYLTYLGRRMSMSQSAQSAAHSEAADLLQRLADVPDTSDLVLVDNLNKQQQLWRGFKRSKGGDAGEERIPGLQALAKSGVVQNVEVGTPDSKALPGWITRRAHESAVAIEGHAVMLLSNFVGPNLRQLDNELAKLSTYALGRSINADDVRLLVSDASEAMIWDLTDALSQRNAKKAALSLQALRRADANVFYLLTMIARQFRVILKVKDAMESSGSRNKNDIAKLVGERPYPVGKAMGQTNAYSMEGLEAILTRLLEADFAMKTGADADTEIDVLIAELTQRPIAGSRAA